MMPQMSQPPKMHGPAPMQPPLSGAQHRNRDTEAKRFSTFAERQCPGVFTPEEFAARASSCRSSHTRMTWATFVWCAGTVGWGWTSGPRRTCRKRSTWARRAAGGSRQQAASGRCSSGINIIIRQDAVYNTPASRRGERSIVLRRCGETHRCGGSHPQQIGRPQGRIWNPGRRVLLVVVWGRWPILPSPQQVFHRGWRHEHHRHL